MAARIPEEILDTTAERIEPSPRKAMATPHLILVGYGITDSLQLTVEGQRVLSRFGNAYSIGLPPNLAAFLKSQRIKVTDLADRIGPGRDFGEAYLDIANFVIERTAAERPVMLLAPGHPMIFNAIGRYLAMEGKRLELGVQVIPGVSQLDLIIGGIGLDVSTFGLQVFDATRLVARRVPVNPLVPAVFMNLAGFAQEGVPTGNTHAPDLEPLCRYLSSCYPPTHPAAVVQLGTAGVSIASTSLASLPRVAGQIQPGAHLFLDLVRPQTQGTPAP